MCKTSENKKDINKKICVWKKNLCGIVFFLRMESLDDKKNNRLPRRRNYIRYQIGYYLCGQAETQRIQTSDHVQAKGIYFLSKLLDVPLLIYSNIPVPDITYFLKFAHHLLSLKASRILITMVWRPISFNKVIANRTNLSYFPKLDFCIFHMEDYFKHVFLQSDKFYGQNIPPDANQHGRSFFNN